MTYEEAHKGYISAIERGDTRSQMRYYSQMHKSIHDAMKGEVELEPADLDCIKITWSKKMATRIRRIFK